VLVGLGASDDFQISTRAIHGGKQRDAAETVILGLRLMEVGPSVVVTDQAAVTEDQVNRAARDLALRLERGIEYSSADMQVVAGFKSDGKFDEARRMAIRLGLIEKVGDSNKAPYRLTTGF
jgi:hypothetical protein